MLSKSTAKKKGSIVAASLKTEMRYRLKQTIVEPDALDPDLQEPVFGSK